MKELEILQDMYLEEIKKIDKKGELTPADDEAARNALEAIEKIHKICGDMEDEEDSYERMYPYHRSYRTNRMPSMDYGRRGRSASTGRYISRNHDATVNRAIDKLESLRMNARDDYTRETIDNAISELENY